MSLSHLMVKHGYTLDDLEMMARAAVVADRLLVGDIHYRRGIAYSAIVEALYASEEPPDRAHLIRVGWQAIALDVRWSLRHTGVPDGTWQTEDLQRRPRFVQYWADHQVVPAFDGKIVEGIAVGQVLDALAPTYRDAIVALAAHDTYQAAADAMGISYKAFVARIGEARKRILVRWFEGETPRRTFHTDRRVGSYGKPLATHCPRGHEWTAENTRIRRRTLRGKPHTSRACRACEAERGAARWEAAKQARRQVSA